MDGSSGDILYQQQTSGVLPESGQLVTFDQWNHYRMILDYTNHKYYAYYNGALAVTSGFVDGTGLNNFTDADIAAFAAGADTACQNALGTAYVDTFLSSNRLREIMTRMATWNSYNMMLGFGTGAGFTQAGGTGDGLDFDTGPPGGNTTPPASNVMPTVTRPDEDTLVLSGGTQGAGAQQYQFRIDVSDLPGRTAPTFTLRQQPTPVPEPAR